MPSSSSPQVCFYFQVHQPDRIRDLRITDIGRGAPAYFDDEKNRAVFRKVAGKCYLPANALMLELLRAHPDFRIAYSLSGVFLDQCRRWGDDVLASFQALAATGRVEFLAETYEHSLSALMSLDEFCAQVAQQMRAVEELFGTTPRVLRNTELIYSNEIGQVARQLGFHAILAEGVDRFLGGQRPTTPMRPPSFDLPSDREATIAARRVHAQPTDDIVVLLKNYRLSDDIAFRFSDRTWSQHPLTAERFAGWVAESGGETVNLFMDYETFGEHQWADSGIFEFLRHLPAAFAARGVRTVTPGQLAAEWSGRDRPTYDAWGVTSWADTERDLSAWQGNEIQRAALAGLFALEPLVKAKGDPDLLALWRRLQTSDHFYYMSTKYWHDGDVHKYFSPYDSPYEAYRRFSHALHDLKVRLLSLDC